MIIFLCLKVKVAQILKPLLAQRTYMNNMKISENSCWKTAKFDARLKFLLFY